MTDPALAPRNAFVGVLVVWATAFLATVVIAASVALTGCSSGGSDEDPCGC